MRKCSQCEYVKDLNFGSPRCYHPDRSADVMPIVSPSTIAPDWCPLERPNPRLRDPRFVPEKLWTKLEMKYGTYTYMDSILQYIQHVLEFQVRLLRRVSIPDIPEKIWALYMKDWVGHINLTLSPKVSVQLQGINLRSEPMGSYLNVFVVVGWAEYPPTINQLTIGIE